ncbi:hypothetical protein [uncultured Senegalimassilia sp.]|jgi:hypothetical protein|uniref:hypothetical protein n=1 Tax=uncultured Senegalimassilia sp. TaxID=1714350 RepID=UPI0020541B07|nr:hypothetical protein [uncultured Senegalimassilia sp.]DAG14725.1 MAG TPA: hypothetical protein [Caudoviricetes sp.]
MLNVKKAPDDLAASRRQENLASQADRQEALLQLVAACADVELPGEDDDEDMAGGGGNGGEA